MAQTLKPDPGSIRRVTEPTLRPDPGSVRAVAPVASPTPPPAPTPTPAPQATPAPKTLPSHASHARPLREAVAGELQGILPILQGAKRAVGTVANPVLTALQRPGEATEATLTRGFGSGLQTLLHGESDQQHQADTHSAGKALAETVFGDNMTEAQYNALPPWTHVLFEFGAQTLWDPTTYVGGAGTLDRLVTKAGVKGLPAFSRLVEAGAKSANPRVRAAAKLAAGAHDLLTYKGDTKRALAAANGEAGIHQFNALRGIKHAMGAQAHDLETTLVNAYHDSIQGLTEEEQAQLYTAIHTGKVAELPPELQSRAEAFRHITDTLAHLSGDPELRQQLAEHGFTADPAHARFEGEATRDIQGPSQFRPHYVPTAHEATQLAREAAGNAAPSIANLDQTIHGGASDLESILNSPREAEDALSHTPGLDEVEDPFLKRRTADAQLLDPDLQQRIIENRLRSGARTIAATDAEKKVAQLFGKEAFSKVPTAAQEFFRETYTAPENRTFWQTLGEAARGAVDIPKAGLFSSPLRHEANISTLAMLADPSLPMAGGTVGRYARMMLAGLDPKQRAAILGDKTASLIQKAFRLVSPADAEARAKVVGDALKYGASGSPSVDRNAVGWIGRIPGVGQLYKYSNRALWAFDDAAKATRFDRIRKGLLAKGIAPEQAAYDAAAQAGAELINYDERSPLTQALQYILPFATYRTKMPVAVIRSLVRHPERALAVSRLAPTLAGESQQAAPNAKGQNQVTKSYLPLAETLRGIVNPADYARASLGYPAQMLASTVFGAVQKATGEENATSNYFTYGKNPDAKYALNATVGSFPGGDTALRLAGLNEFAPQAPLSGAIRSQTGMGVTRGPTPREIRALAHVEALTKNIARLRKLGQNKNADAVQRRLDAFLHYNHLYVQ